jgi:hypothetical protein
MAADLHGLPRLKGCQWAPRDVHLVAVDPGMAGAQAAVLALLEEKNRKVHGSVRRGLGGWYRKGGDR